MIRVLVVDDHPTVRAGLRALLRGEPGLVHVGDAESAAEAMERCAELRPDVVVLDVHLPGGSGLLAARRLKARAAPPRVLLFSAFADEAMLVPALLAGADAVLSKAAGGDALFELIRQVHANGRVLSAPCPADRRASMNRLDHDDQALVTMLLAGTAGADVATVLGVDAREFEHRVERILGRLHR